MPSASRLSPELAHTGVGFCVSLCSITQAFSTSAWRGLVEPLLTPQAVSAKFSAPKRPLQEPQVPRGRGTEGGQHCGGSCGATVLPCPLPRLSIYHVQQCSKHMVKKAFLERAGLSFDVFSISSVYWWLCFPTTKPRRGVEPHGLLKGCSWGCVWFGRFFYYYFV